MSQYEEDYAVNTELVAEGVEYARIQDQRQRENSAQKVKTDIASLLGWFNCEIDKDKPVTWELIGQMEATRAAMIDALCILSGNSVDLIKDGLENV